ncbi:MAG: hypothetical protein Q7R97_03405 [Candidatus Daviesbacteria bacterium]|nr:hypothetical protein [Candidatus Daviesbacteria bacterium]
MTKFLPVVVFVILLIGTIFYIRSRMTEPAKTPADYKTVTVQSMPDNATSEQKIQILEQSVQLLATEIGKINSGLSSSAGSNASSALLETRVKNLETSVNSLKADVAFLKPATSQTTSTATKKSPEYIPLSSGGNSTDKNYYSMGGYQVSIDPADYPGYTNMQLEATLNFNEAVGTINARLYNVTDSSVISNSGVSTSATTPTLVTSYGSTLPSGKKTYVLQVQSTQGYQANVQSARIRVNF